MDTSMKAALCERTLDNAVHSYPALEGAVLSTLTVEHSIPAKPIARRLQNTVFFRV